MESVSYAFLLALETLSTPQRAVLLLRDVFDYSVRETADALGLTETNVKTLLHRGRRSMQEHRAFSNAAVADLAASTRSALEQMLRALENRDHEAIHELLAEQVRCSTDGGGEFLAARRPIHGRTHVLRFMTQLAESNGLPAHVDIRHLNGLPACVMAYDAPKPRVAPRFVMRLDLDSTHAIHDLHVIMAPRKLTAVR